MKEKILAAIKTKFPTAKLTAKRLDAIAATIEAKAGTDETLIDTTLDAFNEFYPLADIATDDHVRATLEGRLKATQKPKTDPPADPPADPANPTADETPAWAKALMADIAAIKGEKAATTIKTKATEKLKDVPASYWNKRALPETEEALEAFVTEVTGDYTQFKQEMTEAGLSVLPVPRTGGTPLAGEGKIDPAIKAHYEQKKQQAAATQN